jgi:MscS family membrane protein
MRLQVLNGVVAPLAALAIFTAAAVIVRLLWRRLLVHGRALARPGRWLAESTTTPVFLLLLAVGAQVAALWLARLPELQRWGATAYLTSATYIFTVLCATWVAYGAVKGLAQWYMAHAGSHIGHALDPNLLPVFQRVAQVVLIFAGLTFILDHYNIKVTALLGAAGVASLAFALAAQDTLANMIAGFTIMADRPFRLGDRVEMPNGRVGDVQEIGLRSTKILSPDYTVLIIPNSEIAKSSVVNYSYPSSRANVRLKIGVAYGSDPARAKQLLTEICRAHPLVLTEPPPGASLDEWRESALQIRFNFWIDDFRTRGQVVDEIQTAIYARFASEGIRFPSSSMEVFLRHETPPA